MTAAEVTMKIFIALVSALCLIATNAYAANVGDQLSCANGPWTNGPILSYTSEFFRDGLSVQAPGASTYTTVPADATHSITCKTLATNAAGQAAAQSAPSNSIPVVSPTVIARAGTVTGYTRANTATSSYDWPYTIASSTVNAALFVLESRWQSASTPDMTSVVVDPTGTNIACSQISFIASSGGNAKSSVWYCPVGGITGTKTVRLTYTAAAAATSGQGGCIMEYSGVAQTFATAVEGANTTAPITNTTITTPVAVAATSGDWLMGVTLGGSNDFTSTPTAPMAVRNPPAVPISCAGTYANVQAGNGMDSNGATINAGTNNVTVTVPNATYWQIAWAIKHG